MSLPWPTLTTAEWYERIAETKKKSLSATADSSIIDLGGPGSGNFGHAGRPGEVGGSGGGDDDGDRGAGSKAESIPAGQQGECFRNAARWSRTHDDFDLVHGKVTNGEGQTLDHAWAESSAEVADPTTGVKMDKDHWYGLVQAQPEARYTSTQATRNMLKTGNFGPWTDEEVGEHRKTADKPPRRPAMFTKSKRERAAAAAERRRQEGGAVGDAQRKKDWAMARGREQQRIIRAIRKRDTSLSIDLYDESQARDESGKWTDGGAVSALAKQYTSSVQDAKKISTASQAIITGSAKPPTPEDIAAHEKWAVSYHDDEIAWNEKHMKPFSDEHRGWVESSIARTIKERHPLAVYEQTMKAAVLVDAVRQAPEAAMPLYRAVGVEKHGEASAKFDALKPGDPVSLDRVTSFSMSKDVSAQFAATPASITGKTFNPDDDDDMEAYQAANYANYQFVIEGDHKSVDVTPHSRYGEQERLTHGTFEVVKVEESSEHTFQHPAAGEVVVPYRRTITLRQTATY